MRKVDLSLLGTFSVGLLVVLGDKLIDRYMLSQDLRIAYEVVYPDFEVSSDELPRIIQIADLTPLTQSPNSNEGAVRNGHPPPPVNTPAVRVQILRIENTGNAPLEQQHLDIVAQGANADEVRFLYTQSVGAPGGVRNTRVRPSEDGKSVGIDYSLLNVREVHALWVVTNMQAGLEVSARRPGLSVDREELDLTDWAGPQKSKVREWVSYVLPILMAFVCGVFVCLVMFRRHLKKSGITVDPIRGSPLSNDDTNENLAAASTIERSTAPTGRG